EWAAYAGQVMLAQREWEINNTAHARDLLDGCRWDFRGWEHAYLRHLFDSNQRTFYGHSFPVTSVAFSPDGKRLVSGSGDKTVRIWDAATGQTLLILGQHAKPVYAVAFSPNGQRVASAGGERPL